MKVALVHDWLTGMRGGERCLEGLCELFPEAPLYTLVHARGTVSPLIERRPIHTSFIQRLPRAAAAYRYYLPLFPWAIERFDLSEYDLIVSSSHCAAKGVRVRPGQVHVSYVHTPMRYLWDRYDDYFAPGRAPWPVRAAMRLIRPRLQAWDVASAKGVTHFLANSRYVAAKILRYYGREAEVVYPPVDTGAFRASGRDDGYYLVVSALVPYKRVDLAVAACARLGRRLIVAGTGPEAGRLRRGAPAGVEFVGWQPRERVVDLLAGCRAVVFPGEEDFGIVPVEAMASGKPVIAYARGGVLETVGGMNGASAGVLFHDPTAESLAEAVLRFEAHRGAFQPEAIRKKALAFGAESYRAALWAALTRAAPALAAARTGAA